MGLREKRLRSDAALVQRLFGPECRIHLCEAEGDPPERYRIEYRVRGLVVQNEKVQRSDRHLVEIFLTLAYPRQAPQCRMLTPVFHPNIAPHAICIGDHWSAGESLAALIVRIAEMLTYQSYNVKSPLNGDAARWAEEHLADLPLERFDFGSCLGDEMAAAPSSASVETLPPIGVPPAVTHEAPPVARLEARTGEERARRETDQPASEHVGAPAHRTGGDIQDPAALPAEGRGIVCEYCGAALSLPANYSLDWARCPLCGRLVKTALR